MKKVFSLLLALFLAVGLLPVNVEAATVAEGACGELVWKLERDGTLTISGNGSIPAVWDTPNPWDEYKDMVTKLVLGDGITSVGDRAFYEYSALTTLVMADTVKDIGYMSFYLCGNLSDITFSKNLETIGDTAFCNCSMTDVTVPDSVRTIGPYAFANNGKLETFRFPANLTTIPYYMFWYCDNLHTVTMGDKVTAIEEHAFGGCSRLKSMNLSNSLTTIEIGALSECPLESIILPDSLTSAAFDCLGNGSNATTIIFSDSIKILKGFPSYNTYITEMTLPTSVINIGSSTFNGCTNLSRVIFTGDAPVFASDIFRNVTAEIAYPKDMNYWDSSVMVDYQGDLTWKPYGQPIFTQQPADYFDKIGTTATFSVKTDIDTGWPEYQWQYSTDNGTTWNDHTGTGADSAQISVVVTEDIIGTMYRCVVTDGICEKSETSEIAQIKTPVEILEQPVDGYAKLNKTAATAVKAVGKDLTYTWYLKDPAGSKFYASSVNTAKYGTTMRQASDGRLVYCVITDAFGNSVTTDTVTLNLLLTLVSQPEDVSVKNGETAKVTINAAGRELTYKWYYANPGSSKFYLTTGFTGDTYSLTMTDARAGRQVYCVITDAFGNTVTTDTVTLEQAVTELAITQQPVSVAVAEGETAKVTVGAVGDGLSYRWYYKNPGASAYTYTSSFKGNSYYVTMNEARNGRFVLCRVYDKYGNVVQTNTVKLSMKNTVKIVQQPVSVTVAEGEMAAVTVVATGDGLTYRWYYKNPGESTYTYTSTYTGNTYKVPMNEARNGRWVLCRVYDKYGNVVQTNTVVLRMK